MATGDVAGGESAAVAEERDWSEMTPVCLAEAFSRLGLEDVWRGAMACCRAWRDAAASRPALFAALDLEPAFASVGADAAEWWTPAFQRRVDAMLRSASSLAAGELREVRVRHCSDDALAFAAERSPKLSILSIRSSPSVSDRSMFIVASSCHMLTELDISYCHEVSYKSLEMIGQNCRNLNVLKRNIFNWLDSSEHVGIVPDDYLRDCPQDGDREAIAISKFMQNLKHLVIRFSKLSVVGLNAISGGCKELEVLDLYGCANLTLRGIQQATSNMKNLKELENPNFYIPRSSFHMGRYGHWQLYDERFQTNVFQI
ncbi:F-box protein SKIP1 [Oryza sativa Japonica Group]|uniref:SKP1 interacting partner 1 n=1 Tax=Oryza sativa subsp. japonica TaxID=39947 RepID=Q6ZAX4_ORYSJ|nr:F-box protein SKIP1 [Oryza sativa Japonica Group]EAZ42126.1 hypothetical protein OsJ_26685 [Oryza sativa Japonica Group]KAF2918919.1 hypothetical protein DAI22_08g095800 [Oryza sativa Japonica Group]USI00313.1 F-box domain and LRR containing protein [Oryza sativa Japonica Group]BAC99611.1 putative SKP1 interacting partner 1 [Oryza sativa Japonica Group]